MMDDGNTSLFQRLDLGCHGGLSRENKGPGMTHDTTRHGTCAGHDGGYGSWTPERKTVSVLPS